MVNANRKPNPRLEGLEPYDPMLVPVSAYLSANESPDNMPEDICRQIAQGLSTLDFNRYPDALATELRDLIASEEGLSREQVLIGNGGDELLFNYALAWGGEGRSFLNMPPTFSEYELFAQMTGTTIVNIPRKADFEIDEEAVLARLAKGDIDFVVVTSPNNPSGNLASEPFMLRLLETSDAMVLVDEAYFEFAGVSMVSYLEQCKNLIVLRTLSKAYGLAGVRLGYILAHADIIKEFVKIRQPYSVNVVSQMIGACVYKQRDRFKAHIEETVNQREMLYRELSAMDQVTAFPSKGNFVLFKAKNASNLWEALCAQGVLVRDFSRTPGLDDCLRVSVGSIQENQQFLGALKKALEERN